MKELMHRVGYQFHREDLLRHAIGEVHSFTVNKDSLKQLGHLQLQASLSTLILRCHPEYDDDLLHKELEQLTPACAILIASALGLERYFTGKFSTEAITDELRINTVEAIIGSMVLDAYTSPKKNSTAKILKIIAALCAPHMPALSSSHTRIKVSTEELMKKLGYRFQNENLLRRALRDTRDTRGVTTPSHNSLKQLGHLQLQASLSALLLRRDSSCNPRLLREELERLTASSAISIASTLELNRHSTTPHSEDDDMTHALHIDTVEAIIGSMLMDASHSPHPEKQLPIVLSMIETSGAPHLMTAPGSAHASASASAGAGTGTGAGAGAGADGEAAGSATHDDSTSSPPRSISPRTLRLFSGKNKLVTPEEYEKHVTAAPNLDRQNDGSRGDTALMTFFRSDPRKATPSTLAKAALLVAHGANLRAPNKKGQTAADLLEGHPAILAELRKAAPGK